MAADTGLSCRRSRRPGPRDGQSLVEVVLILPVMLGMFLMLLRVNGAIQVSIVNQKYARQRLFELMGNSPEYPDLSKQPTLIGNGDNRLVTGVSEESTLNGSDFQVSAPTVLIARSRRAAAGGSNEAGAEPQRRARVRVRNTVEICTPLLVGLNGSNRVPLASALTEESYRQVRFCTGGID